MKRKEAIKHLENLRLEETVFKREKETKALKIALRRMKYDGLKNWVAAITAAVAISTSVWVGFGMGAAAAEKDIPKPKGVYSIEEAGKTIVITTTKDNLWRLSDQTVIVSDKALSEIEKEVRFWKIAQ